MKSNFDLLLTPTMHILLIFWSFIFGTNGHGIASQFLLCHNCPSSVPDCQDLCHGRYCYKAELIIDHNYSTVKRGCLNQTDNGVDVGRCQDLPADLPGSNIHAIERMCICTLNGCNSASTNSNFAIFSIIVLLAICTR
ncbi:unnamed protein product [Thelazia callipaeda]|uniref:Protein quiver n=1 Tax=Thelazia callipaeda TaxID=103827 RepID=A0A158RAZ1_THECL|nr:unnamed protein product [Thelazia callipaeda]